MEVIPASDDGIQRAIRVLQAGGVVAHATETCYGLACDLSNPKAVERLFVIKQRPLDQPVSALCSSVEEAKRYVVFSEQALEIAGKYLPGPLTLVLSRKEDAPFPLYVCPVSLLTTHHSLLTSIGLRLSSHPLAHALAEGFRTPLATTSANLHGLPNPYSLADIASQFHGRDHLPDLLIDSGALPVALPSTVAEVIGNRVRILRRGDVLL